MKKADLVDAIAGKTGVPKAQAQGNRLFGQYCPGSSLWLCRPNDLAVRHDDRPWAADFLDRATRIGHDRTAAYL